MRVGDQTMTINVYNTIRYMDNGEECYSLQDLIATTTADDTNLCYNNSIQMMILCIFKRRIKKKLMIYHLRSNKSSLSFPNLV
ncbi:hypothetical protein GQ457_06G013240 [Hibiscus cannabinus]